MGRLAKGSWHEWPKQHLVGLLGSLWYNMSQSDVFNTTQKPYKHVIHGAFDIVWDGKFDKPAATRWMVTAVQRRSSKGGGPKCSPACFRVGTQQTAWEPVYEHTGTSPT